MSDLTQPGLYERVVDLRLAQLLSTSSLAIERAPLNPGESARRLTQALEAYLLRALEDVPADDRPGVQVALCNQIIRTLAERLPDFSESSDQLTAELLTRIGPPVERPSVPLSESALFINANKERRIGVELAREFASADQVDLICPFFFWPGFAQLRHRILGIPGFRGHLRPEHDAPGGVHGTQATDLYP